MNYRSITPTQRWATLQNPGVLDVAASDQILVEVDTGASRNGTLVLNIANGTGTMTNIEVWTSTLSDFLTDGTTGAAVASDGTALCGLASDTSNLYAKTITEGTISDLTVASNAIAEITQDGMYVIGVKNTSKYLNVQYNGGSSDAYVSAVFIGHDPVEAPYTGAQAAY